MLSALAQLTNRHITASLVAATMLATSTYTASAQPIAADLPRHGAVTDSALGPAPGLRWTDCAGYKNAERYQCADVQVPLDYDRAWARKIPIQVHRLAARADAGDAGTIVVHMSEAGDDPTADFQSLRDRLPSEIIDRYNVIGVRGRAHNLPASLRCDLADAERPTLTATLSRPAVTQAEQDAYIAAAQRLSAACGEDVRRYLASNTAANWSRDLDRIRELLNTPQLTVYASKHGSPLAQAYARNYRQHVRGIVFDGPVEPKLFFGDIAGQRNQGIRQQITQQRQAILDEHIATCEAHIYLGCSFLAVDQKASPELKATTLAERLRMVTDHLGAGKPITVQYRANRNTPARTQSRSHAPTPPATSLGPWMGPSTKTPPNTPTPGNCYTTCGWA